jgi:hypothetical protein
MNAEQAVEYEEGYKGGGTAYGLSVRSGNIHNITAHREDLERLGSAYRAELIQDPLEDDHLVAAFNLGVLEGFDDARMARRQACGVGDWNNIRSWHLFQQEIK